MLQCKAVIAFICACLASHLSDLLAQRHLHCFGVFTVVVTVSRTELMHYKLINQFLGHPLYIADWLIDSGLTVYRKGGFQPLPSSRVT